MENKFSNIFGLGALSFKHGNKYEIVINKTDKDSLVIDYQGDAANLKIGDINNVTIYYPKLPIMTITKKIKIIRILSLIALFNQVIS